MPNVSSVPVIPTDQPDLIVRGNRVVTPEGERAASIQIRGGTIAAITRFDDVAPGIPIHEAADSIVMPGLVDTHVHINEPGRTDWEGFSTATRAAAAGGITTIIEMPLNSIPAVTTPSAYREKIAAASGKLSIDVGFWGGVIPGNEHQLAPLWEAGAFGFKCFLVPSGVDEFPHVAESDLRKALPALAALGAPLLAHAELPGPIDDAAHVSPQGCASNSPRKYAAWLASRPRAAEDDAVALLVNLSRAFNQRVHIVHVSSSDAIPQLRQAKSEGLAVTAETCPHYLTFASEGIADGATEFKCAPPIRERENRERLWEALEDGTISLIATDHSPCPPAMKLLEQGDFLRAWGGIASLQLSLSAVWTEARRRGYSVIRMADWLCGAPARLAGIENRKGSIAVGCDADFAIWNPNQKFTVDAARLHHRHKVTPYAGRELTGVVEATFLRGRKIFDRGEFQSLPHGQVLLRGKM
ncbi:MAG: allantoinase AllB [Candidatus Acidiferrales bacterium]|jgi:allantoinase